MRVRAFGSQRGMSECDHSLVNNAYGYEPASRVPGTHGHPSQATHAVWILIDLAEAGIVRAGGPVERHGYVIAAMAEAGRQGDGPVVGYEANGGFLVGDAIPPRPGGGKEPLAPLPTRDALLPILSLLAMAADRGCPLSHLAAGLPARFTSSDRLQDFPTELSCRLLDQLATDPVARRAFFAELGEVTELNQVDGIRATLATGDIVHLRPSGNAPELRCYVTRRLGLIPGVPASPWTGFSPVGSASPATSRTWSPGWLAR
jgi:hypothetical protein